MPGLIDTPVLVNNGKDANLDVGTHGHREYTDFAPRGGVTFKVNENLVLRGGAGLFYNYQESNLLTGLQQQITNERRFINVDILNTGSRADFVTNPLGSVTVDQYLSGAIPIPPPALRNLSKDYRNPKTFQATLGFQKQVGPVFGFDSDLLYAKGMHLGFDREVNVPYDPATTFPKNMNFPKANSIPRPNPNYASIRYFESTLKSEYLALANSFTRRLSGRWQAGGTYTLVFYNKDHGTNGFGYLATGNNPFCQTCEWGTSAAFQRHTVRLNGIYEAPWGITLAGIYSAGSGTRSGTTYSSQVVSPILVAGGFFGANRYVTGAPFTITDQVKYPDGSMHSNYERLVDGTATQYSTGEQVPRNAFQGLAIHRVDLRISKSLQIPRSSTRVVGTLEVFNLFNRANYASYNTAVNLASFGVPNSAYQPRTVQLAVRLEF